MSDARHLWSLRRLLDGRSGVQLLLAVALLTTSCFTGLPDTRSPFANGDDDDDTYEGDEPGECNDGADNDQDGLFDCADPGCSGAPDCVGDDDDDTTADDDDTTADDDDSTADDDDATADDDDATADDDDAASPNDPVISSLSGGWDSSAALMEFSMNVTDPDCDLGSPTLHWMLDSQLQAPVASSGPDLGCAGYINFSVPSLTRTYAYVFAFSVEDSAGNTSGWESINVLAQ
jgi:hypothetical protein